MAEEKKSFMDKMKKYLKIGAVAGMTMMSTMSDAEAANNNQPNEKDHIKVSGQVMPGKHYTNIQQEYLSVTAEQAMLVRKASELERMGKKEEAQTFKDKIEKLQEKRMWLAKQIQEGKSQNVQSDNKTQKQEFNESLKVNVSQPEAKTNIMSDEEFRQTVEANKGKVVKDPRFTAKLQQMRREQLKQNKNNGMER